MTSRQQKATFDEIVTSTRTTAARRLFFKAQAASRLAKSVRSGGQRLYQIKHAALASALSIAPEMFRVSIDHGRCFGLDIVRLDARNALHTHPSWLRDATQITA